VPLLVAKDSQVMTVVLAVAHVVAMQLLVNRSQADMLLHSSAGVASCVRTLAWLPACCRVLCCTWGDVLQAQCRSRHVIQEQC
jgi:hypothetical protein